MEQLPKHKELLISTFLFVYNNKLVCFGVGSCYIGQGWTAFADPYGQEILKQWNIRTDYYTVLQLLLGYPREGDTHPTPKPRKNDYIIRIGGINDEGNQHS